MIEKLKTKGTKQVFLCPLCNDKYDDYDDAVDCLSDCSMDRYCVQETTAKCDKWICTDCETEFNNKEDANKHPVHCSLFNASKHPAQKKLGEK